MPDSPGGGGRLEGLAALRFPAFRAFWLAAAVSNIGTWIQTMTVPYVVYELTGSAGWLSVTIAAAYLPQFFISPFAGAIIDRLPQRTVLLAAQVVQLVAAVVLAVLWARGVEVVGLILLVVVVANLGAGVHLICWQAIVPSLVPLPVVASAVRLNSMQHQLARAVGPAIAGVVLARFGPGTAFTVNALSFVGVVGVLLGLRVLQVPTSAPSSTVRADLAAGLRYVGGHDVARQAILCAALLAAFGYALVQLAPALATDAFDVDESGYAAMVVANGAGALVATGTLALVGDRYRRAHLSIAGLVMAAAGGVLVGLTSILGVAVVGFFALGAGQSALSVAQNTALLLQVERQFRGRVLSLYIMANIGAVPLGGFVLAGLTGAVGVAAVPLVSGLFLAAATAWAIRRFDAFSRLDTGDLPVGDR